MEEFVQTGVALWIVLVNTVVTVCLAVTLGCNTVVESVLAPVVTASHSPHT